MKTLAVLLAFTFIGLGQVPPVIPTAPLNRVASLPVSCTVGKSPAVIYNASGIDGVYTAQGSPCAYALSPGGSTSVLTGDASGPAGSNTVSKINNVAVPTSATCLSTGSGAAPVSGCPNLAITTAVQGTASSNILRDWPSTADSSLAAQITAIGSTPTTLLVPRTGATVSASATIPATITIQSQQGGILTVASGQTLTILGQIQAGSYQIFAGSGSFTLSGNKVVTTVDAKWFGATGNGTTDDTADFELAVNFATSAGSNQLALFVPHGTYIVCNLALANLSSPNCPVNAQCQAPARIYGDAGGSYYHAVLQGSPSCGTVSTDVIATLNSVSETTIEGLRFEGNGTATTGTGVSCFDARWLATGVTTSPSTANHYRNLFFSDCLDKSGGFGMLADRNEDSEFSGLKFVGYGSTGLTTAFRYEDEGGFSSTFNNFTVSNSDIVQLDSQQWHIDGSFLAGGLLIGNTSGGSGLNYGLITESQVEVNPSTTAAIKFGTNVENLVIGGGTQLGGTLTSGQSIFSGQLLGSVNMIGGRIYQGTGSLYGTITSGGYSPRPIFSLFGTSIDGTVPYQTSVYDVDYKNLLDGATASITNFDSRTLIFAGPISFTGNVVFTGTLTTKGLTGTGSAPTCTVNTTYAGSGATCSVSGTNLSHNVTLNTGTGTTAGGVLVTVTFNGTLATAPNGCSLTPQNTNAVGQAAMVYTTAPSTTAYTISVAGSAIPASISGYTWHVPCI